MHGTENNEKSPASVISTWKSETYINDLIKIKSHLIKRYHQIFRQDNLFFCFLSTW